MDSTTLTCKIGIYLRSSYLGLGKVGNTVIKSAYIITNLVLGHVKSVFNAFFFMRFPVKPGMTEEGRE